jgi:hypothetical protein
MREHGVEPVDPGSSVRVPDDAGSRPQALRHLVRPQGGAKHFGAVESEQGPNGAGEPVLGHAEAPREGRHLFRRQFGQRLKMAMDASALQRRQDGRGKSEAGTYAFAKKNWRGRPMETLPFWKNLLKLL